MKEREEKTGMHNEPPATPMTCVEKFYASTLSQTEPIRYQLETFSQKEQKTQNQKSM
jgi:hypothetical protein